MITKGISFKGKDLSRIDLSGVDLRSKEHGGNCEGRVIFHSANLECANLRGANFSGGMFNYAILDRADLRNSIFSKASFFKAELEKANLSGSVAKSDFGDDNLVLKLLKNDIIKNVEDYHDQVYFTYSILETNQLENNLESINGLVREQYKGSRNEKYYSGEAVADILKIFHQSFNKSQFDHADFTRAKLNNAVLNRAYLRNSHISGAELNNTILSSVDASGANFYDSKLKSANLDDRAV